MPLKSLREVWPESFGLFELDITLEFQLRDDVAPQQRLLEPAPQCARPRHQPSLSPADELYQVIRLSWCGNHSAPPFGALFNNSCSLPSSARPSPGFTNHTPESRKNNTLLAHRQPKRNCMSRRKFASALCQGYSLRLAEAGFGDMMPANKGGQ